MTLMVVIGIYFSRFIKQVRDFYTGGNNIPWWVAGISFYMSGFTAFVFVAYASIAYKYGWVAVTIYWTTVPACLIGAYFFAHKWRRAGIITPVQFLERRYNLGVRQLFGWAGIPVKLVDDGLRIYSIGIFVSVAMGFDLRVSIIVSGIVMLLYTVLGGLWAVTVTDVVQFIVLMVSMLVVLPLSLSYVGGLSGLVQNAPEGFFHFLSGPEYNILFLVAFLLLSGLSYNGNWAMIQRYYSVKNEKEARKVGLLAAFLYFIGPPLWTLPVMASRQILPHLANPEHAYAALCLTILPVGMMGVVLAAMFAATMSALDSDYNVISAVITKDIYQRLFAQKADDRKLLKVGRLTTCVVGLIAISVALLVGKLGGAFNTMKLVLGLALGPMMVPLLMGVIWKRVSWRGAILTFVVGLGVGILFNFGIQTSWAIATLSNIVASFTTIFVCSLFDQPKGKNEERVSKFFEQLKTPIKEEIKAKTEEPSPFFIVGIITMVIGGLLAFICIARAPLMERLLNLGIGAGLFLIGYIMFRKSDKKLK